MRNRPLPGEPGYRQWVDAQFLASRIDCERCGTKFSPSYRIGALGHKKLKWTKCVNCRAEEKFLRKGWRPPSDEPY